MSILLKPEPSMSVDEPLTSDDQASSDEAIAGM